MHWFCGTTAKFLIYNSGSPPHCGVLPGKKSKIIHLWCVWTGANYHSCGSSRWTHTTLTWPSHDPHMILTWPSHDPQLYKITVYSFLDLADQMERRCFMPRRRRTRMCLCCTSIFSTERTTSRSRRVPGWWIRMLCSCESLVTRGNHQVLV